MPELQEQMYCSQQIVIPPKFPYILKRYCKAAIKTQPYDLLRWSYEYFKCLAIHKPPPVKLRLEYPIYSTEGGLTRGCLKVLANQLAGMDIIPLITVKAAWQGFCLDPVELTRILCLCEVHKRDDKVPYLHFIAVAAGFLTKNLTHTMILFCETLTAEPDGGSAAVPATVALSAYHLLARIDASKDFRYFDGYREGCVPTPEEVEEEQEKTPSESVVEETSLDDFWRDTDNKTDLQKVQLINDHVSITNRISEKMNQPLLGHMDRSPSVERAYQIEREAYLRERKTSSLFICSQKKLKALSAATVHSHIMESSLNDEVDNIQKEVKQQLAEEPSDTVDIFVYDEDDNLIPYEIYGEPVILSNDDLVLLTTESTMVNNEKKEEEAGDPAEQEKLKVAAFVDSVNQYRIDRLETMLETFDEIAAIVDRFQSANYDLGMVAGRQMSTTSGEFIVQHIEREIMAYIDEQIAVLPDPDLKKKKAKPEEVAMIRQLLDDYLAENIHLICPEVEFVEEEEQVVPEVILVYAVPGIGPIVDDDIIREFEEYARDVAKTQADLFMPRNIRHFMCPPLERYEEYNYMEAVPTESIGDTVTDEH